MSGADGDAARARILLVEDDDDYAAYLTYTLREVGGHSVTRVAEGDRALELIATAHWDIVVADIHLPGAGGLDLVRYLGEADPTTRSVVVTAHPNVDAAVEALRTRADEFLAKPVPPDELLTAVNRLAVLARRSSP
jgi:DNA-binding NtrC family response regulator